MSGRGQRPAAVIPGGDGNDPAGCMGSRDDGVSLPRCVTPGGGAMRGGLKGLASCLLMGMILPMGARAEEVHLFVMAGQSNMQGWQDDVARYPARRVSPVVISWRRRGKGGGCRHPGPWGECLPSSGGIARRAAVRFGG